MKDGTRSFKYDSDANALFHTHTVTPYQTGNSDRLVVKVEPSGNGPLFTEVNVFQRILKADQIAEFVKLKSMKHYFE